MALQENVQTFTYLSAVAATAGIAEFLAVSVDTVTARSVKMPAASGDAVIGVVYHGSTGPGRPMAIIAAGIARCIAGAAIATPGLPLMSGTNGKLIPATTGKWAIGYSIQAAANNDIFEAHLTGPWQVN